METKNLQPDSQQFAGLELQGLAAGYGGRRVVDGITLRIAPGQVLALIGPNGAGKSTLIKSLSGVLQPAAGTARALGQDLHGLSPVRRAALLAVVPQARRLPENFTVWHTVLMGRTPYLGWLGEPTRKDRERVEWALERTGLGELAQRRVGELSGGEQQRVLLARALAQQTPVLLLDEPTAHLDMHHQASLLHLVRALADEERLAILMALHDLNLVALYADQVALLVGGRLVALGTPQEVLTAERLMDAYQVPLRVIPHPDYGTPLVLPDGFRD